MVLQEPGQSGRNFCSASPVCAPGALPSSSGPKRRRSGRSRRRGTPASWCRGAKGPSRSAAWSDGMRASRPRIWRKIAAGGLSAGTASAPSQTSHCASPPRNTVNTPSSNWSRLSGDAGSRRSRILISRPRRSSRMRSFKARISPSRLPKKWRMTRCISPTEVATSCRRSPPGPLIRDRCFGGIQNDPLSVFGCPANKLARHAGF